MILAFIAAGIGNVIRTKLIKHHFTLFLNIAVSISAACLMYAICLKAAEIFSMFRQSMKPDTSAPCYLLSRAFHLSQAALTLRNWIFVPDWSG